MRKVAAAALAAIMLAAAGASADPIDLFDLPQQTGGPIPGDYVVLSGVSTDPLALKFDVLLDPSQTSLSYTWGLAAPNNPLPDVIGGTRSFTMTRTGALRNACELTIATYDPTSGKVHPGLSWATPAAVTGTLTLTYDSGGSGLGANLSNSDAFQMAMAFVDQDAEVLITVTDTANNTASVDEPLPPFAPATPGQMAVLLPFSDLTAVNPALDFSHVQSISFAFNTIKQVAALDLVGLSITTHPKPVTIGDFVWNDLNGDGIQDAGEPGIQGVTLTLAGTDANGNPVTDHQTTDAAGHYLFTEAPGTYTVTVDAGNFTGSGALAGFSPSPTLQGPDRAKDSNPSPSGTTPAALPGGASDLTVDFGYYIPVPTMRPVSPTQCPPATTQCPLASTSCPPSTTACPAQTTQCPPVSTQCSATQCSATQCPTQATQCPPVSTQCPANSTCCPATQTHCPRSCTQCPAQTTKCPPVSTQCSATQCSATQCPTQATQCPPVSTQCPANSTCCPATQTQCPRSCTQCPAQPTKCPPVSTQCSAAQCSATQCPTQATQCPPVSTQCPANSTCCPAAQTQCPITATQCPPAPTQCPAVQTVCPADPTQCSVIGTYTIGYWKNHPGAWPVNRITIGGVTYTKAQAIAILQTPPRGDATYILAVQLIAAKLNILNGADGTVVVNTIVQADAWLAAHPLGSNPCDPARMVGTNLATTLDNYNSGLIGPGHGN